jgi:hypothetical protein
VKIRPAEAEFFHAGGRTQRHDEADNGVLQFFQTSIKIKKEKK